MASNEAAQAFGNREGDHEMMAGKLSVQLSFEPLSGLTVLTGRAMAVAAGAIHDVGMPAILTRIEGDARLLGAAFTDRIDGFPVLPGMSSPKRSRYSGPKVWKISFMVVMIETLHHLVDEFEGIFLALLGEMQIDHGGFKLRVAHVSLNDAQIHPGFEQMGGIRMAQGVHRDALFADARLELGLAEGALHAAFGHGGLGIFGPFAVSPQRREEQARDCDECSNSVEADPGWRAVEERSGLWLPCPGARGSSCARGRCRCRRPPDTWLPEA